MCSVCGLSREDGTNEREHSSEPLFRRHRALGGQPFLDVRYPVFDLELFEREAPPEPTAADVEILAKVVGVARSQEAKAPAGVLERALARTLRSNKEERGMILRNLSVAGVLQPLDRPSFFDQYLGHYQRPWPDWRQPWGYPLCWWHGADGVNDTALDFYFPRLTKFLVTQAKVTD
jgi:hypothetical protein